MNGNSSAESAIPAPPPITAKSTPLELARASLLALGGDKFKNLKSMMLVGDVNVYMAAMAQSMPAKFVMVTVGDKVRIDVNAGMYKLKQVFDGRQSSSSMPGLELPPASKFGLTVLAKYDQPGYTVSALPDKKKLRGFRIVDGDGNATDFISIRQMAALCNTSFCITAIRLGLRIQNSSRLKGCSFRFLSRNESTDKWAPCFLSTKSKT